MNARSWVALLLAIFAAGMVAVVLTSGQEPEPMAGEPSETRGARPDSPSIILVSLDTLRADHLSGYGYTRPTSPNLDAFARESVLFKAALAQATGTVASHLSLLTSLNPPHFRITRADGQNESQSSTRLQLPREVTSLADALRQQGYDTVAFTDGGFMSGHYGQKQGFEHYRVNSRLDKGLEVTNGELDVFLTERAAEQRGHELDPLFLFVHTFDVHAPYGAPEPFTRAFSKSFEELEASLGFAPDPHILGQNKESLAPEVVAEVAGLYDSGIAWTDQSLAAFFQVLMKHGLYEGAVIAIVSDHGEEFLEHGGFNHGETVYEELVNVPLIIRLPGGLHAGRVVERPVGLVDVGPTVFDAAGLRIPAEFQGVSLLDAMSGADEPTLSKRPVYFEAATTTTTHGLRRDQWKLIRSSNPQRLELYDLSNDPLERSDVAEKNPAIRDELSSLLTNWIEEMEQSGQRRGWFAVQNERVRTPEELEALRALGYIR
jgi:arylsulfatase A-like enzyme